ncbi:MAG: aminotransferase class I/II-fold pyridoxal phosphate-dependent enzyme [Thermoanaerobaculia bacterium]
MNRRDFLRAGTAMSMVGLGRMAALPGAAGAAQTAVALRAGTTDGLRLNSNENALGLAPAAREAVIEAIGKANRYPDDIRDRLIETLAAQHGVEAASIVLGTGSTDILQMIVQAAATPNEQLVLADPTFEAIIRYQRPLAYRLVKVPLDDHFGHDVQQMRDAVQAHRPAVIYICNPNNPTGTLTSSADLDAWIEEAPETVLFAIDEAYYEYVRAPGYWSAVKWIKERPNVVVAHTFSKIYAMAGLRLGYAIAHPDTAQRLREFLSSDNATGLALAAGLASLEDADLIPRSRAANEQAKKITLECLDELGLEHLPSHANFLMHRINGDLDTYRRRMRERGIYVGRPFPPLLEYNRLSLGLPEEMEWFTEVLREFRTKGWV